MLNTDQFYGKIEKTVKRRKTELNITREQLKRLYKYEQKEKGEETSR